MKASGDDNVRSRFVHGHNEVRWYPCKHRIFTICLKKSAAITRTRRSYASSLLVQEPYNGYGDLNVRPRLAAEANYSNR